LPAESLTAGTPRGTCSISKWRAGGFARFDVTGRPGEMRLRLFRAAHF
jgi:hypothetical protein